MECQVCFNISESVSLKCSCTFQICDECHHSCLRCPQCRRYPQESTLYAHIHDHYNDLKTCRHKDKLKIHKCIYNCVTYLISFNPDNQDYQKIHATENRWLRNEAHRIHHLQWI
jgi:hypothetical protein